MKYKNDEYSGMTYLNDRGVHLRDTDQDNWQVSIHLQLRNLRLSLFVFIDKINQFFLIEVIFGWKTSKKLTVYCKSSLTIYMDDHDGALSLYSTVEVVCPW